MSNTRLQHWMYQCPDCGAFAGQYPVAAPTRGAPYLVHVPHTRDCERHRRFLLRYPHWPRRGWFGWHRDHSYTDMMPDPEEETASEPADRNSATTDRPVRADADHIG